MANIDDLITARERAAHAAEPAKSDDPPVIACERLVRIFSVAGVETQALQGLDLVLRHGELTALIGASGSGKTTLLNILAALDLPTGGRAVVAGHDLLTMRARDRLTYRRSTVGFLWQQTSRNLLSHLTVAENIELPMRLARIRRADRATRTGELVELLGIGDCRDRLPGALSGGQQQRTAIGVALANRPAILLADEPTGELDAESADDVFGALRAVNDHDRVTVLVVTHDQSVSEQVSRTLAIRDGRISTEVLRRSGTDERGQAAHYAQEYSVLDGAGRLQLPSDFIEALALRDRVRLRLEPDHVRVFPDRDDPTGQDS
ncbi:MAG: ABC transporter ATP-binding protein [Actinomycetota bacterium]|jgi:ABC-type lipoprotein export system ATPase subunit|nr:ABC transporter ATP-binding protein [Actinomycetota bacterium]